MFIFPGHERRISFVDFPRYSIDLFVDVDGDELPIVSSVRNEQINSFVTAPNLLPCSLQMACVGKITWCPGQPAVSPTCRVNRVV